MDYGLWEGRGGECRGGRLRVGRAEGRGRGGRTGRLPERMVRGGGREGGEYPSRPAFLHAVSQETRQGRVEGSRLSNRDARIGTRWGRKRGLTAAGKGAGHTLAALFPDGFRDFGVQSPRALPTSFHKYRDR